MDRGIIVIQMSVLEGRSFVIDQRMREITIQNGRSVLFSAL